MQLGGYEESNARGNKNGILFYEKPLGVSTDGKHWTLESRRLLIGKERGKKWDNFALPSSNITLKLTMESQFIILPEHLR
ncbi:unnamed protein product [Sphagnum balticum]